MAKQLSFKKVNGWGGKRRGAGRPNKSETPNHLKRPPVDFRKPMHITMKLKPGLRSLRNLLFLAQFRRGVLKSKGFKLHVLQFSIQRDHIHMIAEAADNNSLAQGMKSLGGRLGKRLGGRVFKGRFHLHVLNTPTEMKRALNYVLLNHSKHKKIFGYLDQFSSARFFRGWKELLGRRHEPLLRAELKMLEFKPADYLAEPRSWLARTGWQRAA